MTIACPSILQKVLIVDDDPDLRQGIRFVLENLYEVLEASNGPEALALIRAQRPRVLLLDVGMPDMGGLAILRAAQELYPAMAVIMLTGETDINVANEALEQGARSYMTKPFDVEALLADVERLLNPVKRKGVF